MKIIKPGTGWEKEVECTGAGNGGGGCKAILSINKDDLYKTTRYSIDDVSCFITFCCPCGVETDITGLPSGIVSAAMKRSKPGKNDNGEK